ncbi:MAG: type II toxin-antitoxin system VapC family toxin [Candidatus Heimdallarchaeota archaeon]
MILADTTFLIDCLRRKASVETLLANHAGEILFTTEINVFELYLGIYSSRILQENQQLCEKRVQTIKELMSRFQILPFARKEALESAKILGTLSRSGKPIQFRDGLIAGIAKANGIFQIVTRDREHFERIENIVAISY